MSSDQLPLELPDLNDWREEWVDMPEYNNIKEPEPEITATFKFRNLQDFLEFEKIVEKHLYLGKKAFNGTQKPDHKTAWYPKKNYQDYLYK